MERFTWELGRSFEPLALDCIERLKAYDWSGNVCAFEACQWRVCGAKGAAELLGMKPSTLSSRMKALGIRKP